MSAIVLLGVGCNGILNIEDTVEVGADTDGDGIPDANDICPSVADPDQLDDDQDRVGNACDSCVGLPTVDRDDDDIDDACDPFIHDEDGDGVEDRVDKCPGFPDPAQTDVMDGAATKPDGIGDACDVAPTKNVRLLFDAFDPPTTGWTAVGPAWVEADDAITPSVAPSARDRYERRSLILTGRSSYLEVGIAVPPVVDTTTRIGVVFFANVNSPRRCMLSCTATGCHLELEPFGKLGTTQVAPGTAVRLRLELAVLADPQSGGTNSFYRCSLVAPAGSTDPTDRIEGFATVPEFVWSGVFANTIVRVTYAFMVTDAP